VVIRGDVGEASTSVEVERGAVESVRLVVRVASEEPELPPSTTPEPRPRPRATALTWSGLALLALGDVGILGFGLSALGYHEDYVQNPTADLREQGLLMRNLANASIGIVVVGAALMMADIVVTLRRRRARSRTSSLVAPPSLGSAVLRHYK
jgi:hypothetical protein